MKNPVVWLVTMSFLLLSSPAISSSCEDTKRDKAEFLSSKVGEMLVDKFGGGQDIRVQMTSCEFNSYTDTFKTQIEIRWNGTFFSSHHYGIDGEVRMKTDGSGVEFSQSYASDSVKKLRFWQGVIGGAVILGAVAVSAGSEKQ